MSCMPMITEAMFVPDVLWGFSVVGGCGEFKGMIPYETVYLTCNHKHGKKRQSFRWHDGGGKRSYLFLFAHFQVATK